MARIVSFIVLVAILIGIGILFLQVMWAFLLPLFLAAMLGVVFQPLYSWILSRLRNYRYVSSAVTTFLILMLVLAPTGLVFTLAVLEGISLIDRIEIASVPARITELRKKLDLEIPQNENLATLERSIDFWRAQQQNGDTPQYSKARVDNLLERVKLLQEYLDESASAEEMNELLDGRPELKGLETALERLRDTERETIQADYALNQCDAAFRVFKREFLGGTYSAWLKELANPTDKQLDTIRASLLGLANPGDDAQKEGRTLSRSSPLVALGGNTIAGGFKLIAGVVIMVICLFFFLAEGGRMIDAIVRLSPLEERYLREMIAEFERVSRAVVAATLLTAVAQGILAGIGFYSAGLSQSVALLTILTMFLSMVPFMGAAAVWIPVCLYIYFFKGEPVTAGLLALYGTFIISTADNVIKPIVLHGQSNLHPLLALLSVLGGITTLGPIGIMVGPMAVVFLQTLLKILQREMLSLDRANHVPLAAWAASLAGVSSKDPSGTATEATVTSATPQAPPTAAAKKTTSAGKKKD